jgi:hypothetical protein
MPVLNFHQVACALSSNVLIVIQMNCERNPALVWKSARGEYPVGDAAMHRWF